MNFRILHYKTLDSTNDLALEFAREGASEGTVIVTEYQKHGRGRFRRKWFSPRGKGLLFSIILRPNLEASSVSILTHLAAKSVQKVLKEVFHLPAKLKRPNDLLVNGKKICGILTEASGQGRAIKYVVVGIGLNVSAGKKDLLRMATSILAETGKRVEQKELLERILFHFAVEYRSLVGSSKKELVQV
ncbi:MAG: biotin--[acetyl-CoA-carboxylase] ligase [Candidatus Omnitrophica bacterium]|nr:biotin--[acetyl-CoA-carboxylase] ligase [Candidatus Omnitrophota bacterium]